MFKRSLKLSWTTITCRRNIYLRPVLLFQFLIASAQAQPIDLCILPVIGSEPVLEVEEQQPYRIARDPRQIPGFDGLVVKAFNRHELLEFDGRRLIKIEDPFPHVWGIAYDRGIHVFPDQDAYGFGSKPRAIYISRVGSAGWDEIEETRGYYHAVFDQGNGDVYVQLSKEDSHYRIVNEQLLGEADLPEVEGMLVKSIRSIPEISGKLAITGLLNSRRTPTNTLWFKPDGGEWGVVELNLTYDQALFEYLENTDIVLDGSILKIFPKSSAYEPIFFHVGSNELVFSGTAPSGSWTYHLPSRAWLGQAKNPIQPTKNFWTWLFSTEVEPLPPVAYKVRDGGIGVEMMFNDEENYRTSFIIISENQPALLMSNEGIGVVYGDTFAPIDDLAYERIGESPEFTTYGDQTIIQSEKGVFILNADFSATKVESFPVTEPWRTLVNIEYVDSWRQYVILDRQTGSVFLSPDMSSFVKIESPSKISSYVGLNSDPTAVLLVGEDKLYTLTENC